MQRISFLISAVLITGTANIYAQSLGGAIRTPDKSVPVVNQTLEGTWLYELRRGGQPESQPSVALMIQFKPDGTIVASAGDGTQSSHHGMWLRVGDRKFLITTYVFSFNDARVLTNILKIRGNVQLSLDGATVKGTQEVVVMNPAGIAVATAPGGTFTGTRLGLEVPADFQDFLNRQ